MGGTGLESQSCASPPWVSFRIGLSVYWTPLCRNSGELSAQNSSALAKSLASGQVHLGWTRVWLAGKLFCDGSMGSGLGLELVMPSFCNDTGI